MIANEEKKEKVRGKIANEKKNNNRLLNEKSREKKKK